MFTFRFAANITFEKGRNASGGHSDAFAVRPAETRFALEEEEEEDRQNIGGEGIRNHT